MGIQMQKHTHKHTHTHTHTHTHLSGQWTYPACIYTALHGSYGILWLTKEALYRDASWESPCTGGSALFLFFGMAISFWCNIVILVTGGAQCQPSPCQVGAIATLFILGNWLHHSSDVQVALVLLIFSYKETNCCRRNILC